MKLLRGDTKRYMPPRGHRVNRHVDKFAATNDRQPTHLPRPFFNLPWCTDNLRFLARELSIPRYLIGSFNSGQPSNSAKTFRRARPVSASLIRKPDFRILISSPRDKPVFQFQKGDNSAFGHLSRSEPMQVNPSGHTLRTTNSVHMGH